LSMRIENVQKILIPTDGSDYSIRASIYGLSVAKLLRAEIVVVYVVDTVVLDQVAKISKQEDLERELTRDGSRYIKYVLGLAEKEGVKASSLIVKGRPFEEIVHVSRDFGVDLIVMGTYGHRGAERILIGSVAERVIEYASCPVLVVR
jgi:nucleotide-binding universal stress UspA family protein